MDLGIKSISETSHPMLVMVLIGLGVFMAAGLVVYIVDELVLVQDVDAAKSKFDKLKKKSNIREA